MKLNLPAIRAKLRAARKKQTAEAKAAGKRVAQNDPRIEAFDARAVAYLKKVVAPQLQPEDMTLTLTNSAAAKILGCTPSQADETKRYLRSLGIIYCPEWARPKAKHHRAFWFVRFAYLEGEEVAPKKRKPATKCTLKYTPEFYAFREQMREEVKTGFREIAAWVLEEDGEVMEPLSGREIAIQTAIRVKQHLLKQGLTKEAFLRQPVTPMAGFPRGVQALKVVA